MKRGFLTDKQREKIRDGEIEEKYMMKSRILESLQYALDDLSILLNNYQSIEGQNDIQELMDDEVVNDILLSFVYILPWDRIQGEDLLFMLLKSSEENWKIEGSQIHGSMHEIIITSFIVAFQEYDSKDPMTPEVDELEGWNDLCEIISQLNSNQR